MRSWGVSVFADASLFMLSKESLFGDSCFGWGTRLLV